MPHTILLVDDEVDLCSLLAEELTDDGYHVLLAHNGQEALAKLQSVEADTENHIDLVITDINMPVMNGIDLIQHLNQSAPGLPVLVMTAYGDKDIVVKLLRIGISDFIDKPVQGAQLSRAARKLLTGSASGNPREELRQLRGEMQAMVTREMDVRNEDIVRWIRGGFQHRFNQPLTVLRMNVGMMKKILKTRDLAEPATQTLVQEITQDLESATLCVSDLLTLISRMDRLRPTSYIDDEEILDFEGSAGMHTAGD